MDSKKMMALAIVAILAVAAVGVVYMYQRDDSSDHDLEAATWAEIEEMAKGQTVNLGFYSADVKCTPFYQNYLIPKAKSLGITVTMDSQYYGPNAANFVKTETDSGVLTDGRFDLIWGDISPLTTLIEGGVYKYMYDQQWVGKMPNTKYLTANANDNAVIGVPGFIEGTAAEFSNGQTMLMFNELYNALSVNIGTTAAPVMVDLPYNAVALMNGKIATGFLKVASTGITYTSGAAYISTATASSSSALQSAIDNASTPVYSIDSVRGVIKAASPTGTVVGGLLYGLPNNFTELYNWIQIYQGQFTYPDPTNVYAAFHTDALFQAMIFELTWNNETAKTGWKAAPDRDANVAKVNAALAAGIDTQEKFDAAFGYLYNYLNAIDPFTNQTAGMKYIEYPNGIGAVNGHIVGNIATDKDYSSSTVMVGMTTVTSSDMRLDQYPNIGLNLGVFSLDTGCKNQYYLSIPANSSSKAGAMVVANLLLDPEVQAEWFRSTGNGYNIDTTMIADGDDVTIYEKYFFFTAGWSYYLTQDVLSEVTVNATLTGQATKTAAGWVANVK